MAWLPMAEEVKVLTQVLTGNEANTAAEEVTSAGKVSAVLNIVEIEAAAIFPWVEDCGR